MYTRTPYFPGNNYNKCYLLALMKTCQPIIAQEKGSQGGLAMPLWLLPHCLFTTNQVHRKNEQLLTWVFLLPETDVTAIKAAGGNIQVIMTRVIEGIFVLCSLQRIPMLMKH